MEGTENVRWSSGADNDDDVEVDEILRVGLRAVCVGQDTAKGRSYREYIFISIY